MDACLEAQSEHFGNTNHDYAYLSLYIIATNTVVTNPDNIMGIIVINQGRNKSNPVPDVVLSRLV